MRLTYEGGTFAALTSFAEKDIPKEAGFRWNKDARRWETRDSARAALLLAYADDLARESIASASLKAAESRAASKAYDSMFEVPAPNGLSLMAYQRAGVAFLLDHEAVLLADEMGLGKTIQAIGAVNCSPAARRVLVICPASLRLNWKREWSRWNTTGLIPTIVKDVWPNQIADDRYRWAVIISYEMTRKWRHLIERTGWDVLIVDEAHALKNEKAYRTRAVLGGLRINPKEKPAYGPIKAARRLFLTGTPIVNRPGELWGMVKTCDPYGMGASWSDYQRRYVDDPLPPANMFYWQQPSWIEHKKRQRMVELHDRLRSRFMIRRLKADVLKELPNKRRQMILVEGQGAAAALAAEQRVLSEKARELAALRHEHAVQKLAMWKGAVMQEIAKIRHDTALAKAPDVIEHLWDVLAQEEKCVCFTHHHDVSDRIMEAFPNLAVLVDGRTSHKERDEAVKRFQTDRSARLFVGSIRAAGLGITLTAASTVVFAELDWTPAAMVQAEDRLHRIGQKDAVLVQHLVIDGSIDAKMSKLLIEKAEMIDAVLDGKTPEWAGNSIVEDILK